MVKLLRVNDSPMVAMVVELRVVKEPAFSTMMLPVTCSGPLRSISPETVEATRMEPLKVVHEDRAVASAAELTVAVA